MTSRIPPSRRDPKYAPQRVAKATAAQTPGLGRVSSAAPVLPQQVDAKLRGKATPAAAASGLAIVDATEPSSPATGQLWYDTDATC